MEAYAMKRRKGGFTMNFHSAVAQALLLIIGCAPASAETGMPSIRGASLSGSVWRDDATGIYTYSYVVRNPEASTGFIRGVSMDVSMPETGESLSSDGLTNGPRIDRDTRPQFVKLVKTPTVALALS